MTIKSNDYLLTKQRRQSSEERVKAENVSERFKLELEVVQDPAEAEFRVKDAEIASYIGAALVHKYPGHGWQVEADSRNGIAKIFASYMSLREAYVYKLKNIDVHTFDREMMRIGGEILERFKLSRNKFNISDVANAVRDGRGNVKADLT